MARPLACPVCRITLPAGDTHCPLCGLRIAALPRRTRKASSNVDIATDPAAGATTVDAPISVLQALARGGVSGLALVAAAALVALVVTRGNAFAAGWSNAAFFTGGVAMTVALVLGGVRVRRIVGDLDTMRHRARHGPERYAHDHVRLAIAVAATVSLAAAVVLALAAH
jgi:hypothetical protein